MDWVEALAIEVGYQVVARAELPAAEPQFAHSPDDLMPTVKRHLAAAWPAGIYTHQAAALRAFLDGRDVCLATSTASGKSMVFMAASCDTLLRDPTATVLTLYPARALIQDQIAKWKAQLVPFGISFGYIDGGVAMDARSLILGSSRVLVMTPDVTHAWLMSHLSGTEVRRFLASLRLLILDEAHVYEGVFGTNMAYLLRRLQVVSTLRQVIASTATLGEPASFLLQLTGRDPVTFGPDADGSGTPRKDLRVLRCTGKPFDSLVSLLAVLSRGDHGRFLAFADSRRVVEQIVAALHRPARARAGDADTESEEHQEEPSEAYRVLPYRAGYEEHDRKAIQEALSDGRLAGVVSTSALELGIDIGSLDVIVLLGPPPSVKAFRQRLGRVGRKRPGTCLMIDDKGLVAADNKQLERYLARQPEPSWLYLENRYIQYANALCASVELAEASPGAPNLSPFKSLPPSFTSLLENEMNPREVIAGDLYPLKQRAQAGPHREFPLRSGVQKEFRVCTPDNQALGTLTFSQALREGYPGAVYHYMARPYRVYSFDYRRGEIRVKWERRWTTQPLSHTKVFPRFQGGLLAAFKSAVGFLAEVELQVSERVVGFTERRGGAALQTHKYGPTSDYYQRPIDRFFQTTGVCWFFPDKALLSEEVARAVLQAFCLQCSVQERDLGVGDFYAQQGPSGPAPCQGMSIYDAADGSLRLTQRLGERFGEMVETAISLAGKEPGSRSLEAALGLLLRETKSLEAAPVPAGPSPTPTERDWCIVIKSGSREVYLSEDGATQVEIVTHRYTPQGLLYELVPPVPGTKWLVNCDAVHPINGVSQLIRYNLVTGESQPLSESGIAMTEPDLPQDGPGPSA